ncbi:hypothetical protein MMC17_002346 [Xylographa soralifera]|nr:hypothetical protein [Xylographa soralifera]
MGGGSEVPPHHISNIQGEKRIIEDIKSKNEIAVLVTGFGPFPRYSQRNENTSNLITKLLPSDIAAHSAFNPTSYRIKILNPTSAEGAYIRVEYAYIRQYIQKLYDEYEDTVHLMLHLGMADGWDFYTVERFAYQEGFTSSWSGAARTGKGYYCQLEDEAGKTAEDITEAEGKGMWLNMPMGLGPSLDVDGVAKKSMEILKLGEKETNLAVHESSTGCVDHTASQNTRPDLTPIKSANVVPHHEAGSYCCGFIYYESLATSLKRRKRKTNVLFSHVPGESDERSLQTGRDAVLAVIGAASELMITVAFVPTKKETAVMIGFILACTVTPSTPSAREALNSAISVFENFGNNSAVAASNANVTRNLTAKADSLIDRFRTCLTVIPFSSNIDSSQACNSVNVSDHHIDEFGDGYQLEFGLPTAVQDNLASSMGFAFTVDSFSSIEPFYDGSSNMSDTWTFTQD